MGGETHGRHLVGHSVPGLSPRGRGNRKIYRNPPFRSRSIPAWAGKPQHRSLRRPQHRVYPRVGGETVLAAVVITLATGLSPRGRGNPLCQSKHFPPGRSIPAWAGKPPLRRRSAGRCWVYPRVGGETDQWLAHHRYIPGLSPRGRGNRWPLVGAAVRWRSIPAWAGKPRPRRSSCRPTGVYPRVGGETFDRIGKRFAGLGLSPRGRGNQYALHPRCGAIRSIPAWAGKPTLHSRFLHFPQVYPRVGGETTCGVRAQAVMRGLSPRGRGNLVWGWEHGRKPGSIPAWAGKPSTCS